MMKLHNLKAAKGSTHSKKRVGRGEGSGRGGTSTRGHKGQKSRSGYSKKRNFEGGQMPLQMRLPKRGFKNIHRVEYVPLNLDTVQMICDKHGLSEISIDKLYEHRYIKKNDKVKVLGGGEITSQIKVKVHKCSVSAKEAIESKGGTVELI